VHPTPNPLHPGTGPLEIMPLRSIHQLTLRQRIRLRALRDQIGLAQRQGALIERFGGVRAIIEPLHRVQHPIRIRHRPTRRRGQPRRTRRMTTTHPPRRVVDPTRQTSLHRRQLADHQRHPLTCLGRQRSRQTSRIRQPTKRIRRVLEHDQRADLLARWPAGASTAGRVRFVDVGRRCRRIHSYDNSRTDRPVETLF
jgi:hypothetical protein